MHQEDRIDLPTLDVGGPKAQRHVLRIWSNVGPGTRIDQRSSDCRIDEERAD